MKKWNEESYDNKSKILSDIIWTRNRELKYGISKIFLTTNFRFL